jgi:hypothetical protein
MVSGLVRSLALNHYPRLQSPRNSFTEGMQNAAPCYCMLRCFLLRISFNGKQFHAKQILSTNEIDGETKAR